MHCASESVPSYANQQPGLLLSPQSVYCHPPAHGDQPVDAGRGICEGRCWGSTPRFFSFSCARLRTTFRRARPRIASILRHWRGSTRFYHSTRAVTECPGWDSASQLVPTRLARIPPDSNNLRHGMIRGWVSGGQGCYRLTRGGTGPSQFRAWVALATGARFPSAPSRIKALSLSLSLSHTHTHTHHQRVPVCVYY